MPFLLFALALLPRQAPAGFTLASNTVAQVQPLSNAARAGLLPGDTILHANPRSLLRQPHGTQISLSLLRNGQPQSIPLTYLAPPPEQAPGITIEYGELQTQNHRRRTLLTRPANQQPKATVFWIAGSGCDSQENSPQSPLLHALSRSGYATLRIEKTGVGDSEGPPCYSPAADLTQELRAYSDALATLRPVPTVLFGHSAGATILPLLLAQSPHIKAAILAGGMGTPFLDYLLERRQISHPADQALNRKCLEALLTDQKSPDEIEAAHPDCRRRVRFDSPPALIAQFAKIIPSQAWQSAPEIPVLILHGIHDEVTSLRQSQLLQKHIPQSRLQTLPIDHDLQQKGPPGKLHQGVPKAALRFLNQTTRGSSGKRPNTSPPSQTP